MRNAFLYYKLLKLFPITLTSAFVMSKMVENAKNILSLELTYDKMESKTVYYVDKLKYLLYGSKECLN
ncbi:hypothetical protein BTS2_2555 [Bacillus sp. TS-2]|nr:hypothetical protein BTS2_2555 [Bacillus sp. TS-2]